MLYRSSPSGPSQVLVPTSYQIAGNQIYQVSGMLPSIATSFFFSFIFHIDMWNILPPFRDMQLYYMPLFWWNSWMQLQLEKKKGGAGNPYQFFQVPYNCTHDLKFL